jgi:hypothetical protein
MDDPAGEQVVWRFRLPRAQIGYVRMIVEAYDGLAVVATPVAGDDIVEWWIPAARLAEAGALEVKLARETGLVRLR